MKIYTGYPGGITKITNDKGFYQTEDLVNVISVYVNQADVTGITYTLALEFLRADGRKTTIYTEDSFASGEATTLTEENVTYDIHNFTLTNTQLAVAGALAFTCYINILNSGVVEKRGVLFNAVSNVRKTVTYSANTIFVVSEDEEDVPIIVADMKTAIETLSNQLTGKVNTSDVADNLTTNDSSKVLSAKQGYILKTMLDTLTSTTYTKTEIDNKLNLKADKSDTYTKAQVDNLVDGLYVSKMYGNIRMSVSDYNGELVIDNNVKNRYVDPTWYHLQVGDKIVFNGNTNYKYWLAIKDNLSDNSITDTGWLQETYVANAEVYVRITLAKTDNSNISIDFAELLGEDVITIHTRKPVTVRIGTVYNTNLNSYLFYSGTDIFNHRLRTSVIKFNKGDIINFKEYGTEYAWAFMGWNFDGTLDLDTGWKTSNFYVVPKDYKAVIIFKKSDYAQSLLLKGNIYYQKGLDGATNTATCVIVLDNTCVKTGDTITITNNTNAIDFKVDFLSDQWGQGTTTLQTIAYGTTSATVTADMDSVKNVVITIKKSDGTAFSNISSELLWYIYRTSNITKSNGEYFDTEAIYDVDFEVNGEVEPTKFISNLVQIGHRGWDEYAPENTIPSFDLAYKFGCRFLEGDIRFTFDGVPVMLHDVTLNRTARNEDGTELSSTINIANITYAQALEYDFGIYQGDLYQGTKIPTFEEMIKWLKLHNDVYFQIDLTTGSWSNSQVLALYKIVAKYGMFDNLIWESGSSTTISYLISLGVKPKNTMVSYYSSITTANVDTAYNLGCKVFSIQYSLATYSLIQYVISKGMKPYIWFDSADKYAYNVYRLTNLGVVGFYNTNISDIYALRWFKTFIGTDGNTASSITDKDTALLNQAYSDISTLERETENLKQASLGNIMQETTYINTNPSKSTKVVLSKLGGMSYKSENLLNIPSANGTQAGVTYTIENGIITLNGIATSDSTIRLISDVSLKSGYYALRGFFSNGTLNTYFLASNYVYWDDGNGKTATISNDVTDFYLYFAFKNGVSFNNFIIKPMLVSGSTIPTTYKPYGILDSAITQIRSKNGSTIVDSLSIPTNVFDLTGYGWGVNDTCYTYIDFDRKVFVQKVGRVDLGSLNYITSSLPNTYYTDDLQSIIKKVSNNDKIANLLSVLYVSVSRNNISTNMSMSVNGYGSVHLHNDNYTTAEAFKTAMNGVYLYYELATPVETDISSYITKDTLEVVEGGTLEFLNTYNQAVPNEVAYLFNAVTLNNVVDSNGNPRFIEGNGTKITTITGITLNEKRWSLSGTHLMIVLSGSIASGITIPANNVLVEYTIPLFIYEKLTPHFSNVLEIKNVPCYAVDWTTQTMAIQERKIENQPIIRLQSSGLNNVTADRNFKVQFDLLIDSE